MIWKGVYSNIEEIPRYELLDTQGWVESQIKKLKDVLADPKKFQQEVWTLEVLLASTRHAKIVDYGGSLALSYAALGCPDKVEYHVVETSAIFSAAHELREPKLSSVKFHDHPSKVDFNYDILHTRTALQYAADWKKDLELLLRGGPTMVSMAHTSCGSIPTYLTTQEWYGSQIPYWFINQKELRNFMKEHGYTLVSNKRCQKIEDLFFDDKGNHDIPRSHILKYTRNLLFCISK